MVRALIFDFDGLILETEQLWFNSINEFLKEYGKTMDAEVYSRYMGTGERYILEYVNVELRINVSAEEFRTKTQEYILSKLDELEPREGVREYLEDAKKLRLKIGLASNSRRSYIEKQLKRLRLFDFFDSIKTGCDVLHLKPEPDVYIRVLEDLDVQAYEAIAFEDSLSGISAAKKAGIPCVAVVNSLTKDTVCNCLKIGSMSQVKLEELIKLFV